MCVKGIATTIMDKESKERYPILILMMKYQQTYLAKVIHRIHLHVHDNFICFRKFMSVQHLLQKGQLYLALKDPQKKISQFVDLFTKPLSTKIKSYTRDYTHITNILIDITYLPPMLS